MKRRSGLLMVGLAFAALLAGCLPEGTPAYVNDGRVIVAAAYDQRGEKAFWTYDVQRHTAATHPVPKEWAADPAKALGEQAKGYTVSGEWRVASARMIGEQVWVTWETGVANNNSSRNALLTRRFDPALGQFVPGLEALGAAGAGAMPCSYKGGKYLLLPEDEVRSFPELKKVKGVDVHDAISAGGFAWVRQTEKNGIDVFDSAGKRVCTIPAEEVAKAKREAKFRLVYACASEDGKALFLVHLGNKEDLCFGIFDTTTGKYLWGEKNYVWTPTGVPVVKRDALWVVQANRAGPIPHHATSTTAATTQPASSSAPARQEGLALVRYVPGKDAGSAVRQVVATFPITPDHAGGQFAPAPDGSHFVMVVNGQPSRLIFIPIKMGTTEKDIRVVDLVERKCPPMVKTGLPKRSSPRACQRR